MKVLKPLTMVRIELLEEALRGGEVARVLCERTKKRKDAADRAVREALRDAPGYIKESRGRHSELVASSDALNIELDMLGESLEDITLESQRVVAESRANAQKVAVLDELVAALPPFKRVAQALHASDSVEKQSFLELQITLQVLRAAITTAHESNREILIRASEDLQERAEEVCALLSARFMDLFQVKSNMLSARYLQNADGERTSVGVAADTLDASGLLPHAIKSIVAELERGEVAHGLRAATLFFSNETEDGSSLEWTIGDSNSAELLEFEIDDLDEMGDADVDAMTAAPDISNAAARAVRVFDLFRNVVLGDKHAASLAVALRPWFANAVLPTSGVVLSARRAFQGIGVPKETVRGRARGTAAAASVVERALRARGAKEFTLALDTDAIERTVGAECRGEALLAARRAIGTFADADHDATLIVRCPLASPSYLPREARSPSYFPSCLVSQAGATVLAVFSATREDALEARAGGSAGIASALDAASVELLSAYVSDIPLQHGDELHTSLRLKALYYNDCMTLAHSCRLSLAADPGGAQGELGNVCAALDRAAQTAMLNIRKSAEDALTSNLDSACRNGALGAYGTLTRLQRASSLAAALSDLRETISVLGDIVATEVAELAAATLCDRYLVRLCDEVLALVEISAEGCEQIDTILSDADANVDRLMHLVAFMSSARGDVPPPAPVGRLIHTRRRVIAYREVLNGRMEGLVTKFREGKYDGLIDRNAMEHFLVAIFEDTPLRASFVRDLDMGMHAENDDWNTNW